MFSKKGFLLLVFLFWGMFVYAQLDQHTWFFGGQYNNPVSSAGIRFDFNTNTPVQYNGVTYPLKLIENNIILSDQQTGEVLFYSDGQTIVDGSHSPMPNGTGLNGSRSAMYGTTIVFDPSACDRYYMFSVQSDEDPVPRKVHYSVVDLTLAGNGTLASPLGDIDNSLKNVLISSVDVDCGEALFAISKPDSKDSWVFFSGRNTNTLYLLEVTASGVTLANFYDLNVLMPSLPTQELFSVKLDFRATMNDEGILLIAPGRNQNADEYPIGYVSFNRSTGTIVPGSYIQIEEETRWIYGVTFSPDASKIYYSDYIKKTLKQYDIATTTLTTLGTTPGNTRTGSVQVAPDGKIYWANKFGSSSSAVSTLAVVNSPNLLGTAADLQFDAWMIGGSPVPQYVGALPTFGTLPFPSEAIALSPSDCGKENGSATVNPGEGTPTLAFLWDNGEMTQTAISLSGGEHFVTLTDEAGCEEILFTTIDENTELDFSSLGVFPFDPTYCDPGDDGMITLNGFGILEGNTDYEITYNLNGVPLGPFIATTDNGGMIEMTNLHAGVYADVTLTQIGGSQCSGVLDVNVELFLPDRPDRPDLIVEEGPCLGDPLSFSIDDFPGVEYHWTGPNGFSATGASATVSLFATDAMEGIYTVVAENNNCFSISDSTMVIFPSIDLGPDNSICEPMEFVLDAGAGFSNYTWLDNSTEQTLIVNESGTYAVTVTDNIGCQVNDTIALVEIPNPEIQLPADMEISLGESVAINALVNASGSMTAEWTPVIGLSCTDCLSPLAMPFVTTSYNLLLTDEFGCSSMESIIIAVTQNRNIFIPNGFSPNGDNVNDEFVIFSGPFVKEIMDVKIFGRWGNLVFEAKNLPPGETTTWDGTFNGENLNPGVFAYIIDVEFIDGKVAVFKGALTLVR